MTVRVLQLTIAGLDPSSHARVSSEGGVLRFFVWAISAALRPKPLLVAENLCLRQRLLVLQRRQPMPRRRNGDRQFWICASRWFTGWRNSLLMVAEVSGPKRVSLDESTRNWHARPAQR
jgi:hypothetical protein